MNFMFEWQEQYLTCSLCSLVRYCSCHSNIKFISSRHRVTYPLFIAVLTVWSVGTVAIITTATILELQNSPFFQTQDRDLVLM